MTSPTYQGLPLPLAPHITETREFFQALDNFTRTFAFRAGDRVLLLTDPLLDPRVVDAVSGHARARGAVVRQYPTMPGAYKALLDAKVDAVINDYGQSRWYVKNNTPKFRYAGVIPVNQQYGIAFNDDQDQLRVAMNRALAKMKKNGQYQRLINRWGLQSLMP